MRTPRDGARWTVRGMRSVAHWSTSGAGDLIALDDPLLRVAKAAVPVPNAPAPGHSLTARRRPTSPAAGPVE